jgi:hypothetical protein
VTFVLATHDGTVIRAADQLVDSNMACCAASAEPRTRPAGRASSG